MHCQNMDRECVPSSSGIDINNDEETESVNQMKRHLASVKIMLRSTLSLNLPTSEAAKSRNADVLPCVCIICESEKSYFPESASLLIFFTINVIFSNMCFIIFLCWCYVLR